MLILKKKNNYSGNAFTLIECLFSIFICNLSIFIFIFSYSLVSQSIVKNEKKLESLKIKFEVSKQVTDFFYGLSIPYWNKNVEIFFNENKLIVKNCFGDELGKIEFNEKIRIEKIIVSRDINDFKNNVVFQYYHPDLIENPVINFSF